MSKSQSSISTDEFELIHRAVWQVVQDAVRAALLLAEVDEEEHGQVGAAEGRRGGQGRHLGAASDDASNGRVAMEKITVRVFQIFG